MEELTSFLQERLSKPLPGKASQLKMAPEPAGGNRRRKAAAPSGAQPSSVLVLLLPNQQNKWELVLTLRSNHIDHGGQISFPGGRREENETVAETALREAKEEVGVRPESVDLIGRLSNLYIRPSNNEVCPVVGFLPERPRFEINPDEVEEVFTIEIETLLHKKNLRIGNWTIEDRTLRVPFWDIHHVPLWGATAMMISELLDLYQEYRS